MNDNTIRGYLRAVSTCLRQLRGRYRHGRSDRRAFLQLRAMDDHELTDIGIGRGDICHHLGTGRRILGQIRR